ncbi:hypothetical protein LCGC14_0102540 [marine sediment metagenome]|uniref:Penicillin-binding protein 2 n=1 Tax=marine sediment metagenome TaxID=412755 RepID=A0A0F9YEE2_9ZZZZ|nr:penicillin-binding protein 2 [Candidatus Nealsonbacteria bacterium]
MSAFYPKKPDSSSQSFLKNKKVKISSSEEIEPQEIFLDSLAKKREEELDISEKKFEIPLSRKIILGCYFSFLLLILVFLAQTFYLQVVKNEDLSLLAQDNKTRFFLIRPNRGVIYDKVGYQLVFNQPSFDLVCDKRDFPWKEEERSKILTKLSQIINKDIEDLRSQIETSELLQVLITENLDQATLILLETNPIFSGKEKNSVCRVEMNTIRDYISGTDFAHLIGYVGRVSSKEEIENLTDYSIADYIGKTGLEKSYEKVLRGNPGKREIEKNVLGQTQLENLISEPEDGKSLVLWLDSDLQKKITAELNSMLKQSGAKAGVGVAIDPKTGGILSLVSLPGFDNNLFSRGIDIETWQDLYNNPYKPFFNRVISGEYLTGSTIKPLIAAAALEENLIDPQKQILAQGYIQVPHQYNPEIIYTYKDWKVHGWTDMRKAIADSVNVYFYTIGGGYENQAGLGPTRIKKYLELFSWGQKTGVDLPGEKEGLIPDPAWKERVINENWYDGNTYHLSIGQGYLRITPLQVVTAFAAIANGGTIYRPQAVQRIVVGSADSPQAAEEVKPEIIRNNFISSENLEIVREGMREAVTYGSSVILNALPVKVAAKTGTAETDKEGYYHNWVTVFAPYEDPQIVLTIMVENVQEGMVVALPVAREILKWYFTPAP